MKAQNATSKFHGLTIVHPHSGRVSRSVIVRIVKNLTGAYAGLPFYGMEESFLAHSLIGRGMAVLVLKDENGKISLDRTAAE